MKNVFARLGADFFSTIVFLAIYAGVPAGVDSFRIAREVFAELDKG